MIEGGWVYLAPFLFKHEVMIMGDPKDMNQEGIFENVESLDLNYFQAAALAICLGRQATESRNALEYYKNLRADEIDQHETLTFELVEEEQQLHETLLNSIREITGNLEEVIKMLEPTDGIVKPKQ